MTIAFIRTYNNKQNSEVQEAVIREFAESQKIEIGKWAKEVGNSPRANRRLESIVKSLSVLNGRAICSQRWRFTVM